MSKTPIRTIRIPDVLWANLQNKATKEHTTASGIIIRLLLNYLEE